MKTLLTENQIRKIIRGSLVNDHNKSLRPDLREAVEKADKEAAAAAAEIDKAATDMRKHFNLDVTEGVLEGFLGQLGIVNPCDLTKPQRLKFDNERDDLQRLLDDSKRMDKMSKKERLSFLSKLSGLAGAGSMLYFLGSNKANLGKRAVGKTIGAGLSGFKWLVNSFDSETNLSDEEWREENNQKLQQQRSNPIDRDNAGQGRIDALIDQPSDGIVTADHLAIAAQNSEKNADDATYTENELAHAANYLDRITGMDRTNPEKPVRYEVGQYFPDKIWDQGGDLKPQAMTWAEDSGLTGIDKMNHGYLQKQSYDSDGYQRREIAGGGLASDSGDMSSFLASAGQKNAVNSHPDFKDYQKLNPDAFKAVITANTGFFKERGYNSIEAYHTDLTSKIRLLNTLIADSGRMGKFMRWMKSQKPTDWELHYDQNGKSDAATAIADVATFGHGPVTQFKSNLQQDDMITGRSGNEEISDAFEDWDNKGWGDMGAVFILISISIAILDVILSTAAGPACSIGSLAKDVVSSLTSVVSKGAEVIKNMISGIFSWTKKKVTGESVVYYNEKDAYFILKRWNTLRESARMIRRANLL